MNLKSVQQLLDTEMDRREFLAYIGAFLLAVIGISGLLKSLAPSSKQDSSHTGKKIGYGGNSYGGK